MTDLQSVIDKAFDNRAEHLAEERRTRAARMAVAEVIAGLDSGKLRVAEKIGGDWVTHQWLKKAVLLSFRLEDNAGDARRLHQLLRQGAGQVRGLRRRRFPRGRFPRGAARGRARSGSFIAQERGAHALLREHRRLRRRRHHGGHLGHGRLLRADRQERAPVRRRGHRRRAGAGAGQSDHHRGQLLHRRPLGRSSKASSSAKAR